RWRKENWMPACAGMTRRPNGREIDFRDFPRRPRRLCAASAGEAGRLARAFEIATRASAEASSRVGAAGGASLHATVAIEFLDRHAVLSARLVHDEIQPARVQHARDAAGVPRAPSARAGVAQPGLH